MRNNRKKPNPITPTKGRPAPPAQLTGEARAEWDRVCDELDQMGTLCTSDRSVISLYVKSWESWMHAQESLTKSGGPIVLAKTKVPMQNPWVSIARQAHEQAVKLLGELGLTPRSRSIITKNAAIGAGDQHEPQDDFAELDQA